MIQYTLMPKGHRRSERWPSLTFLYLCTNRPDRCAACAHGDVELERWQEHDDQDKPSARAITLCGRCSSELVPTYRRKYTRLAPIAPMPGLMQACVPCIHRMAGRCRHPDLKTNGGPGLNLSIAKDGSRPPICRGFELKPIRSRAQRDLDPEEPRPLSSRAKAAAAQPDMFRAPVYVDPLFYAVAKNNQAYRVGLRNGHMWCHLWSDDVRELHRLAGAIGLKPAWAQLKPGFPHYDCTPIMREAAIKAGAVERDLADWIREKKETAPPVD